MKGHQIALGWMSESARLYFVCDCGDGVEPGDPVYWKPRPNEPLMSGDVVCETCYNDQVKFEQDRGDQ